MTTTKVTHFALDGGEIPGLNLNDLVATQNVNNVSIKRKVRDLSCRYRVTLIYPVAQERWILEVPRTLPGAIVRRKSPKRDAVDQLFEELSCALTTNDGLEKGERGEL
jgi:hypothetical protein